MSREVLGSALEDDVAGPEGRGTAPRARSAVRLDDKPLATPAAQTRTPTGEPDPDVRGRLAAGRSWAETRLDDLRRSRPRTAAALAVVALVSALLAVGVTERIRQAGIDRAGGVVAWLDYSSNGGFGEARVTLRLNVVNTGTETFTVTAADLEGGLEGRVADVRLDLADEFRVAPASHASGRVEATVADCTTGAVARGGVRDGGLRVTVAGADLRSEVIDGARIGDFPISTSTIVELACGGGVGIPVVVERSTVRADDRLYLTVRGTTDDVTLGFTAPDGITVVTDPPLPVHVPGGVDAPSTTIGVDLRVDTCTVSAQQLDAGSQIMLEVGDDRYGELDYFVVNPWVVRKVALACG